MKSQIVRSVFGTAGLNAIGLALNICMGVLLARSLGKANFGFYSFVLSMVMIMGLPIVAGLPTLIVREVAKHKFTNLSLIRGLLKACQLFAIGYSAAAILVAVAVTYWLWPNLTQIQFHIFCFSLILLPLMGLGSIFSASLRGFQKTALGQMPEQLIRPLTLLTLLGTALLVWGRLSTQTAILLTVAAYSAATIAGYFLLKGVSPEEIGKAHSTYAFRDWSVSLLPLTMFAGLKTADTQLTNLFLGALGTMDDVGLFRIATQGALLVSFGLIAVNLVIAPHVARMYAAGQMDQLQRLITKSTRVVFAISIPIACVFIFLGTPMITLVFGAEYIAAATPLAILTVGQLFNVASGAVVLVLNMAGHEKETVKGIAVAVGIKAILAIALIPIFGVVGAAIASAIAEATWNLILLRATFVTTGINTFVISA